MSESFPASVLLHASLALLLLAGAPAALAQKPQSRNFDVIAKRAAEASAQNRLSDAIRLYRQALTLRPRWTKGWWSLGTLLYDQSEYANAARAFQKVVALDAKDGTARAMLGLCQYELGQDGPALANLQQGRQLGLANDPQLVHVVLYHTALLLLRRRMFASAQDLLTKISADGVQNDGLYLAMGMAVLRIMPENEPPSGTPGRDVLLQAGRAEALAAMNHFHQAQIAYLSLVDEYPNYPNLHFAYGRFLLEIHDTHGAVEQFKEELKSNPTQVDAMLEIAAVRYRLDSAAGVKYAEQAVRLAPQLPFAHYLLGLLLLDTGRTAEAIPHLEIARKAFPMNASIYFALGNAYAKTGRKQEALEARKAFLRLRAAQQGQAGPKFYGGQTAQPTLNAPTTGGAANPLIPHGNAGRE